MTKKRILVVEDQGIIALDEAQIMRDLGYEVIGIVMTGEDAILRAAKDRPDLILMDIKLAGEMDGRRAYLEIQKSYEIPVVFVTAYGDKESSKSGNFSPPEGVGYVVKPFTKEELKREVERLIG